MVVIVVMGVMRYHHHVMMVMMMINDHDVISHGCDRCEGNATSQDDRGNNFLQHRVSLDLLESRGSATTIPRKYPHHVLNGS